MIQRSTIQLLRVHFSFFLLPVYLFAISQVTSVNVLNAIMVFVVLHLLVYPASNGYNSYMDRDETPIGGIKNPLQPTKQLFYATVIMDALAVILSLVINYVFAVGILLYILASRAYSYRGIRLKRYPIGGFITVFIFQGAVIFYITYIAVSMNNNPTVPVLSCITSSLLLGALYPLTQIYQHEQDRKDGVITISLMLGKKGTFIFSMLFFIAATLLMYIIFSRNNQLDAFVYFLLIMLPVVSFFLSWFSRVWKNEDAANFNNSYKMNVIATICTTIFFTVLLIQNH
ncbi:MAG: UbiA family prenyltransferase [Candidatus Dadabacteria bacterium]